MSSKLVLCAVLGSLVSATESFEWTAITSSVCDGCGSADVVKCEGVDWTKIPSPWDAMSATGILDCLGQSANKHTVNWEATWNYESDGQDAQGANAVAIKVGGQAFQKSTWTSGMQWKFKGLKVGDKCTDLKFGQVTCDATPCTWAPTKGHVDGFKAEVNGEIVTLKESLGTTGLLPANIKPLVGIMSDSADCVMTYDGSIEGVVFVASQDQLANPPKQTFQGDDDKGDDKTQDGDDTKTTEAGAANSAYTLSAVGALAVATAVTVGL